MATEVEAYEDPITSLANDPDLNKQPEKTNKLIGLISGFSLAERKVSKLCLLSLTMLQTLEKVELNLKNWAFLSLDINSDDHFENDNHSVREFNNSISMKVLTDCQEINRKLSKISVDLDYVTKALRTLTPIEYLLDSGTLLTSLTLRNIKLKHELTDKVTVAYLKATLITIGTELEGMLTDDGSDSTVTTYKSFVVSLLKQLNAAIEDEDTTEKHECLAVISDMEKMFEAFKLEKAQEYRSQREQEEEEHYKQLQLDPPHHYMKSPQFASPQVNSEDDTDSIYDSEMGSSMHASTYSAPLIHSITKSEPTVSPQLRNSNASDTKEPFSPSGSGILHKTSLMEEMPYLMSAFDLAKNVEKDIKSFQEKENPRPKKKQSSPPSDSERDNVRYPNHKNKLRDTLLTSESAILQEPAKASPISYLYSNNSLLSRLGIRPQIITMDQPAQSHRELAMNTTVNISNYGKKPKAIENDEDSEVDKCDKENSLIRPLTQKNLATHNFSSLNSTNDFNDHVE